MIKIRRNCKEIEGKSFGARKSVQTGVHFAAPTSSLRNRHFAAKPFRSPIAPSAKNFAAVKHPFGTPVPFRSPVHLFHSCKMVAKSPHLKILQRTHHEWKYCSRTPIGHISKYLLKSILCMRYVISKLRKSGVHSFKRCSIWSWNGKVMAFWRQLCKPWAEMSHLHFETVGHISEHFLELKLFIIYLISNIGKSGVQHFKRCANWSWNEEIMAVWRRTRKAKRKISQLLAHECHFTAAQPHFAAVKWAAKMVPGCENPIWLRNVFAAP